MSTEPPNHEQERAHTTLVRTPGERVPDATLAREGKSLEEITWAHSMLDQAQRAEGEAREAILGRIAARFLKFTLTTEVMRPS